MPNAGWTRPPRLTLRRDRLRRNQARRCAVAWQVGSEREYKPVRFAGSMTGGISVTGDGNSVAVRGQVRAVRGDISLGDLSEEMLPVGPVALDLVVTTGRSVEFTGRDRSSRYCAASSPGTSLAASARGRHSGHPDATCAEPRVRRAGSSVGPHDRESFRRHFRQCRETLGRRPVLRHAVPARHFRGLNFPRTATVLRRRVQSGVDLAFLHTRVVFLPRDASTLFLTDFTLTLSWRWRY